MTSLTPLIAAADGSALGNPGPAGWAWYIDEDTWDAGGWPHGTNNMGELQAVLELLTATAHEPERPLRILCDSQYVINCLTKWMPGWKKKGWKKADGKPVLNQDLLKALDAALVGRTYEFEWVKGHAGHNLNERADDLAREAATAYRDGAEPRRGPGYGHAVGEEEPADKPAESTPLAASAEEASPHGDALEMQDFWQEEESRAELAQRGPQELALEAENRLLALATSEDPSLVESLLAPEFLWVTPAGRRVDRATVLEHRQRAFAVVGEPEDVQVDLLNESTALVVSTVLTPRGSVLRSSFWVRDNYRNEIGPWVLRFRQETAH